MRSKSSIWTCGVLVAGLVAAVCPEAGAGTVVEVAAEDPVLTELARSLPIGGRLVIEGLFLESLGVVDLDLERFQVFADDALILAGDRQLPVPDHAYLHGTIVGLPDSLVVLGVRRSGAIDGLISSPAGVWRVSRPANRSGLEVRLLQILEESRDRPFECATDDRLVAPGWALPTEAMDPVPASLESHSYTARVALDTDWEFLQKFSGDVAAATDYVGDLIAFSSSIYETEVDTSLHIGYLKWWTGPNADVDPWTQSNCSAVLSEFRSYWNTHHAGTERTVAHLLSGKSTGCGIAYVGVLCSASWGYGATGNLSGRFDPLDPTASAGFWDIMAVSHELGHNFGSPHTHCYMGVLGNPDPVDECYAGENGCFQGTPSLPGCSPGGRCGTIMSYCHLRSGGYGNIALTFGAGHPFGEDPWRVPTVMNSHVVSRANSDPACLAPIGPDLIFEDDFESGGTGDWSETSP